MCDVWNQKLKSQINKKQMFYVSETFGKACDDVLFAPLGIAQSTEWRIAQGDSPSFQYEAKTGITSLGVIEPSILMAISCVDWGRGDLRQGPLKIRMPLRLWIGLVLGHGGSAWWNENSGNQFDSNKASDHFTIRTTWTSCRNKLLERTIWLNCF